MIYINHNHTMQQLTSVIEQSINKTLDYMPNAFNEEQHHALELLKKRVLLEEVVEESVAFNKKLNFDDTNKNLRLINSVEELIKVFKLRSDIYTDIGYQKECPDIIEGLNFDKYDKNAAILFCTSNNIITGTARLIFDTNQKLPSESKYSFEYMRQKYENITELSRLIIKHKSNGLNVEFKYLTQGIYEIYKNNAIDIILSGIRADHYKLYSKFGGTKIEKELNQYGLVDIPFVIMSWDPSLVSNFFKRVFL